MAATAIRRVVAGDVEPSEEDRHGLALFAALQGRRTPRGRRELRFFDELTAKLELELYLSDRERFAARTREREPDLTDDEIEALRQQALAELGGGDIIVESTPEREVGLMFTALDQIAPQLVVDFDWLVVEAPDGKEFVLSDVGLSHFDPTPPSPEAGTSWRSSPNSQTNIAIDRRFSLVVTPGHGRWGRTTIDADDVDDLNLRSYAASEICFYGSSQKIVCDLRALAKRSSRKLAAYRPRAGRLWIAEGESPPSAGVQEFTGHSVEGKVTGRFNIDPRRRARH